MKGLIGFALLIGIGWAAVTMLPFILPIIGYAIAGFAVLWLLAKIFS